MNDPVEAKTPHLFGRQLLEAELTIASHYLHHPTAPLRESPVRPHHFACLPALSELWERGLAMEAEGQRAELTAFVYDESSRHHFDLIDRITDFGAKRPALPAAVVKRHEDRVIEAATLRMLRGATIDLVEGITDQSLGVDETLAAFEELAELARSQRSELELETLDDAIADLARETVEAAKGGQLIGLPMPLRAMQERLGGWRPGRMHIVLGITSGHKSTMVRMAIEHLAAEGHPSLLVSYEDPNSDFAGRSLVAVEGGEFTTTEVMNADFGPGSQRAGRLSKFIGQVEQARRGIPMYLHDKPMTTDELISFIYRATRQYKLKAIGIDFLQLIRADDPRTPDVTHLDRTANRLQAAAKDLGIALIVAAQPTQAATHNATRNNIALGFADVKGAAAISQACFGLLALHFPLQSKGNDGDEVERVPGKIMVIPRKWKSGKAVGSMTFDCDGAHDRISDIEPDRFYG